MQGHDLQLCSCRCSSESAKLAVPTYVALAGIGVPNQTSKRSICRISGNRDNAPACPWWAVRGDPRDPSAFRFDFDRHANHRPPPCASQVASPREVAAMNTPHPTYPRLQALLGAALPGLQLSTAVAEALEDALAEANEQAPAFFAGCAASLTATRPTARRGANGNSARRAAGTWPRRRCLAAVSACGASCWRRSRHARWMMRRRSVRRRWRKACCMRWWCWPIMPGAGGTGCVRTAAVEPSLCSAARRSWRRWDSCRPRSAPEAVSWRRWDSCRPRSAPT